VRVLGPTLDGATLFAAFVWWRNDDRKPRGGLAAVDARSGTVLWSRLLPRPMPQHSTFPSRPAAGDSIVVVSAQDGYVYALRRSDGSLRWTAPPVVPPPSAKRSIPEQDLRAVGSDGHVVIAGSGLGYLTAFDAAHGHQIWQTNVGLGAVVGPIIIAGPTVYTSHLGGYIASIDAATGAVNWRFVSQTAGLFDPSLDDATLYATGVGGLMAIRGR
jgi:outer membrane protein assembly factor BamB